MTIAVWLWLPILILIVCAIVVAVLTWRAERRYPPIGQFITSDGVKLHYVERGPKDGCAVLLLHGNGGMIQDQAVAGLLDRAAERYRVFCFDRPGYGYSERPRGRLWTPEAQASLLIAALRQLGIKDVLVVGHSWGAIVAAAMALNAPDMVRGVVLASGYYFPTERRDVWLLAGPATPVIGDLFLYTVTPLLARALTRKAVDLIFAPQKSPARFWAAYPVGMALRPISIRASAEEAGLMIPAVRRLQARYDAWQVPTVVVFGDADRVIETDQGPRLQAMLPRSVLRRLDGQGHMIHYSHPHEIVAALDLIAAWPAAPG